MLLKCLNLALNTILNSIVEIVHLVKMTVVINGFNFNALKTEFISELYANNNAFDSNTYRPAVLSCFSISNALSSCRLNSHIKREQKGFPRKLINFFDNKHVLCETSKTITYCNVSIYSTVIIFSNTSSETSIKYVHITSPLLSPAQLCTFNGIPDTELHNFFPLKYPSTICSLMYAAVPLDNTKSSMQQY